MEIADLQEARYYNRPKIAKDVYSIYRRHTERHTDKIFNLDTRYWEHDDANVASLYFDFPPDVDPRAPIRIVKSFVKRHNIPYTDIEPDEFSLRDNDVIVKFVEKKDVMEARYKGNDQDTQKVRFGGREQFMNSRDVQHVFSKANVINTEKPGHLKPRVIYITVDETTEQAIKIDRNLRSISEQNNESLYYGYELEWTSPAEDNWYRTPLREARYAGKYQFEDIVKAYGKLADQLMYNWRSPVRDSASRTKLVNDRVAMALEFVMRDDFTTDQSLRYIEKLMKAERLPYTTITKLRGSGNYFEAVYVPNN